MSSPSGLAIRSLAPSDIDRLRALDRRAHGHEWSLRTYADELDRADRLHLVGEVDGVLVGHAAGWHDGSTGRVTNLAVDERRRGAGHGGRLLVALLSGMLAWHPLEMLSLEVRTANRAAQRMYLRFGFAPVGVCRDFYSTTRRGEGNDALVMTISDPRSNPTLLRALAPVVAPSLGDPGEAA